MFNIVPKHQEGRLYGFGGKRPCMLTVLTRRENFRSFYLQENIQDPPLETDGSQSRYEWGYSERISIPTRNKTPTSQKV